MCIKKKKKSYQFENITRCMAYNMILEETVVLRQKNVLQNRPT